ncbi:MAG: hypothetical protein WAV40_00215 [Microgenomates group bacterium]
MDNKKEQLSRVEEGEVKVLPVEAPKSTTENTEVSSWMEKIEKKFARVPNDTSDVADDSVVVQPNPQSDQPPVTLPVNQIQMQAGKKAKTDTGIAWLVTWAIRQIKRLSSLGRRVRLEDMPEVK